MGLHTYLLVVVVGSALIGQWLVARLPRLAPTSARGAGLCFLAAWLVLGLAVPLFAAALAHLAPGPAVLATVFPFMGTAFALVGLALRYVAGLLDQAR